MADSTIEGMDDIVTGTPGNVADTDIFYLFRPGAPDEEFKADAIDLRISALGANVTVTAAGRALIDDANAGAQRTTLGLVIGTDVQAHSAVLDATTASFLTADETKLDGIEASADVTDATNVAAAGAGLLGTAQEWTRSQNFNATTLTALGADLVLDGDMDVSGSWTVQGTGWSVGSGVGSSDATQSADSDLTQTPSTALVNGNTYEVTFTVTNYVAGNITPVIGGTEGTDRGANGTFVENIIAGAGADIDMRADLDFDGDIDDVLVKIANVPWNLETDYITTLTLDGDLVIDNPTNMVDGMTPILRIIQPSSGGPHTVTFGSAYKFPGATAPTLSTGANDRDKICFDSDGTNIDGVFQGDFS